MNYMGTGTRNDRGSGESGFSGTDDCGGDRMRPRTCCGDWISLVELAPGTNWNEQAAQND